MKKIKISQGKYALVDDQDFEKLAHFTWWAAKKSHSEECYAVTRINRKYISMHRLILDIPKGFEADHINGDGLDNTRNNLRVCTHADNMKNRRMNKNNTSGHRGIFWNKVAKRWYSFLGKKYLGYSKDKEEAIKVRDKYAKKHWGDFATLNTEYKLKGGKE